MKSFLAICALVCLLAAPLVAAPVTGISASANAVAVTYADGSQVVHAIGAEDAVYAPPGAAAPVSLGYAAPAYVASYSYAPMLALLASPTYYTTFYGRPSFVFNRFGERVFSNSLIRNNGHVVAVNAGGIAVNVGRQNVPRGENFATVDRFGRVHEKVKGQPIRNVFR